MKSAIVLFPGTNREHDMADAIKAISGNEPDIIWYTETALPPGLDLVVLPGGFSYGDYLRSGAMASCAPIINAIKDFAAKGGRVLGVCNGFQILTECGLLPGALLRNNRMAFICDQVTLQLATDLRGQGNNDNVQKGSRFTVPIAHGEGNYFADETTMKQLQDNDLIAFHYVAANANDQVQSNPNRPYNPNGSLQDIAGILNTERNILGMMPHPENAVLPHHITQDGRAILSSFIEGRF